MRKYFCRGVTILQLEEVGDRDYRKFRYFWDDGTKAIAAGKSIRVAELIKDAEYMARIP